MHPELKIQKMVSRVVSDHNISFNLPGVRLPREDAADPSGFLPILFEQQQALSELIGLPDRLQPKAYGQVLDDHLEFILGICFPETAKD